MIKILKKYISGIFKKETKKLRLFLDDEREAPKGWITVRPWKMDRILLKLRWNEKYRNSVECISFDHDLGDKYPSGYSYFVCLEDSYYGSGIVPPMLYVHSMNPVGRKNIVAGIESLNRRLGRDYNPQILPFEESIK